MLLYPIKLRQNLERTSEILLEEGGLIFRRESKGNEDGEMDNASTGDVEETRSFIVTSKE